jgi:hypothetical protein
MTESIRCVRRGKLASAKMISRGRAGYDVSCCGDDLVGWDGGGDEVMPSRCR